MMVPQWFAAGRSTENGVFSWLYLANARSTFHAVLQQIKSP
jgi:hypothetical protein